MFERESLQACKFTMGEVTLAVGVDEAGAGGGHASGLSVAVMGGFGSLAGGCKDVVVGPAGRDVGDGVVDRGTDFKTGAGDRRVCWFRVGGEGFTGAGRILLVESCEEERLFLGVLPRCDYYNSLSVLWQPVVCKVEDSPPNAETLSREHVDNRVEVHLIFLLTYYS